MQSEVCKAIPLKLLSVSHCTILLSSYGSQGLGVRAECIHKASSVPRFQPISQTFGFSIPNVHCVNTLNKYFAFMTEGEHKLFNTWSNANFKTNIFSTGLVKTTCLWEVNELLRLSFPNHAHIQNQFQNLTTTDKVHYSDHKVYSCQL